MVDFHYSNSINLDKFVQAGLYLFFSNEHSLSILEDDIDQLAELFWNDKEKISPEIKMASELEICQHCPEYGKAEICKALKPLLPYIDDIDKFISCDSVLAIYSNGKQKTISISHTSMQEALYYLTTLSLVSYCEMGELYKNYFFGIEPFMSPDLIAKHIYRNIYFDCHGSKENIKKTIDIFNNDITSSTECLIKRLRLICKNDALINAFVNTKYILQYVRKYV